MFRRGVVLACLLAWLRARVCICVAVSRFFYYSHQTRASCVKPDPEVRANGLPNALNASNKSEI